MRLACALALVVLALPGASGAQEDMPLTAKEVGIRSVSADLTRFFPVKPLSRGVSGVATVLCTIDETGKLTKCALACESPAGYGFGDAAVKSALHVRVKTVTKDGAPTVGRRYMYPMFFSVGGRYPSVEEQQVCATWSPE